MVITKQQLKFKQMTKLIENNAEKKILESNQSLIKACEYAKCLL
jgi:hypothetical protein